MTTVCCDRTLGKKAPSTLKEQGLPVELHRDHFARDAFDAEWLPEVSRRGWAVVDNKVGLFVLASGHRTC